MKAPLQRLLLELLTEHLPTYHTARSRFVLFVAQLLVLAVGYIVVFGLLIFMLVKGV